MIPDYREVAISPSSNDILLALDAYAGLLEYLRGLEPFIVI